MSTPPLNTKNSGLQELTDDRKVSQLLKEKGPLMIIVYAKWCGHCQKLFRVWEELAKKTKGKSDVYVIESDNYTLGDVGGFPDMRVVKNGKVAKYHGEPTSEGMKNALLIRLGGKRSRRHGTRRFRSRVRKTTHRTFRRNVPLV